MRTSPIHYIAPSSIEITPNANNSYNDLAVYIAPQTKIRVYCPRLGLGAGDGTYSEWDLTGRNRRLADSTDGYTHTKVYTIYARLNKQKSNDGYLVFTPKQQYNNKWYDKYSYITKDGLSISYNPSVPGSEPGIFDDANYWYVKLGEVSAADSTNQRTVDLDTGILGTDQWNSEWALNPDALPLRIDAKFSISNIVGEAWASDVRYVRWEQVLRVSAQLVEGWTGTEITRFHHWAVTRDTESQEADASWNEAHDGTIDDVDPYRSTELTLNLVHQRGIGDDFNGKMSAIFTFTAYEVNPEYTPGSGVDQYLPLISSSFSVMAEPVESYDLEVSSETVTYNPQTGEYSPAIAYNEQTHQYSVNSGVTVRVRAKDADGKTFYPTDEQIDALGMYVYYQPMDGDSTTIRRLNLTNGRGTLPSAPFLAGKSVNTWLQVGGWSTSEENIILSQKTITYIRFGAKGDTPVNCYRWYKEGLTPLLPTDVSSDEPAPASGDATGASNVYPTTKWSATIPDRPATGEWILWMCSTIRHGDNTRDVWSGPVQMSGAKGDPGEDAENREYIYMRLNAYPFTDTQYHPYPSKINTGQVSPGGIANGTETNKQLNDWVPNGWSDTAMPAQSDAKYVYMSVRIKEPGQQWGAFSAPVLWTNWGVQGTDGDGVQYVYKLFDHELTDAERTSNIPTKPASQNANGEWIDNTMTAAGWSDDVLAPTEALPFCYCSIIKRINGTWGNYEKLGMWSKWAKDGESITKTGESYRYATNNTGTRPAADSQDWSNTKPTLQPGYWLYTETTILWSDNTTTVLYTSERNPNDGQPGMSIVAGETTITYCVKENNAQRPADSEFHAYNPSEIVPGKWLWSKATTPYYKGSTSGESAGSSSNYNVSYIGQNGADGADGRSIVSITEYYKASDLDGSDAQHSETAPSDDSGWDTDPNLSHLDAALRWNESHKYLWNYEKITYSSGTPVERTTPQILAIWTKNGKGIDSITNYYKVTNTATPPSRPQTDGTEGWSSTPIAPGQGQFLWNYEKIAWTDGSTPTYTEVQQIGYAGIDGENGENAVRLDLDNQHEDFIYDDLGNLRSAIATSQARLYDGATQKTSGITWAISCDDGANWVNQGNTYTSGNAKAKINSEGLLTVEQIYVDTAKVTVRAIYNSLSYYAAFTANKVKQDKYDLKLSPNVIPYNPANEPQNGVNITPSVTRTDLQGNTSQATIATSEAAGNLCVYKGLVNSDGTIGAMSLLTTQSFNVSGSTWGSEGVYFELRKLIEQSAGGWSYRLCDKDSVPFAKVENGQNGTNADVWTIGNDGYWYKNSSIYINPATNLPVKAEGKDGTGVEIKGGVDKYYSADATGTQTSLQGLTNVTLGDCYIVNDDTDATHGGHLYFYQGGTWPNNWRDLGKIKGEPGTDGTTYYYHLAWATAVTFDASGNPDSCTGFTLVKGNTNYAWMGICVDDNQYDPGDTTHRPVQDAYKLYEWDEIKGANGADAVVYNIDFTDKTFALNPTTGRNVVSIKGAVFRMEGSTTTKVTGLTASMFAMRFIDSNGTARELSAGSDFGIQNGEVVTYFGNGEATDYKKFVVDYKPDGTNVVTHNSLSLTVYGEKGMDAISGYADYLYSHDDAGNQRPDASASLLGKIDLLSYNSSSMNRIAVCETNGSSGYVWKGYGKDDYPDGTMFVCRVDNHIYRASATGWVDEGRFKGDNAVVYKIDFTDSTFAYDPNNHCNVVDVKGIVYKVDGGNTSVFTSLGAGSSLELYFLHDGQSYNYDPVQIYTIDNGAFSTIQRNGAETRGEKGILAIVKIGGNEVARANIAISQYAEDGSRGKRGRSYYYAQPWENTSDVYLVNDSVAPYFLYNDNYYVYNPIADVDGPVAMSAMGTPSTANPNWERMENEFKYIITEAIFGKYADFGSFRITGNWLYSELGEFLGENTEDRPNILHKLYDFRKSYPDDVTEVNLPACNYIHPEDPNITFVTVYDNSEESGAAFNVTTKTNCITDDDDAWLNLKSGVMYSFQAYFTNCKFYLRKNRVKRASIVLYKRSPTTISAHGITTTLYYKFSDGKLYTKSGNVYTEATDADLNNWKLEKPADNGNPCYIIQAAALGAGDYDQIQTTEWSEANILHEGDAVDVRYIRLYKRSSSAVTTVGINTALYYKFSDGKLYKKSGNTYTEATSSDLNGWSLEAPTGSTDQLYLTAAIANRYVERDEITSSEWVSPTPLTFDDLTLMYSSSSLTTQLVYFELAEDGEYQFIVEEYAQGRSAYLNWLRIRENYFLAYIAINGRNGYILQRNSHGHYNGTGNFTEAGIGSANISKMHSGGTYSEGTWIDIENGRLDISRYSQVRVVEWSSNPSATGVNVLGYLYVDSDKTIKFSESARSFYNLTPN